MIHEAGSQKQLLLLQNDDSYQAINAYNHSDIQIWQCYHPEGTAVDHSLAEMENMSH